MLQQLLFPDEVRRRAASRSDQAEVVFDDRSMSWADVDNEADHLAAGLYRRGVRIGDPVLIVSMNRSEMLVAFVALARLGAIAAPLNPALRGESLRHLIDLAGARVALVERQWLERLREATGGGEFAQHVICLDGDGSVPHEAYKDAINEEARSDFLPAAPEAPWAVLFTSGTTGRAKGVLLPHRALLAQTLDVAEDMEVDASSTCYSFHPLFHLNAVVYGVTTALYQGGRCVIRREFPKAELLADLCRTGATHWSATAYPILQLLDAPTASGKPDGLRLRAVPTYGLARADAVAFEARFGARVLAGYGSTEVGLVCRNRAGPVGSSGPVNKRMEVRIQGEDGRLLPPGEPGEIQVRVIDRRERMIGYFRDDAATAAAFDGEWFKTGDRGFVDADGNFYFADRVKESLKRRGENISTFEVESALLTHPAVVGAAVVGYRAADTDEEEVRAFIEVSPDYTGDMTPLSILQHASGHLAYFMVPRFLEIVPALPRNAISKVEKFKLNDVPLSEQTFDARAAGARFHR